MGVTFMYICFLFLYQNCSDSFVQLPQAIHHHLLMSQLMAAPSPPSPLNMKGQNGCMKNGH